MEIWELNSEKDAFLKTPIVTSKKGLICQLKEALDIIDQMLLSGQRGNLYVVFSEEEKKKMQEAASQLLWPGSNEARLLDTLIIRHLIVCDISVTYITDNPKDLMVDIDANKPNKSILVVRVLR